MALDKQGFDLNFSKGLDTKTDPYQVPAGNFLTLENAVFNVDNLLKKRNGFGLLSTVENSNKLSTFNGNLVAIGEDIQAYIPETASWVTRGTVQPVDVNVQPVVRSSAGQTGADTVVAANGLACTAFTDSVLAGCYTITDTNTKTTIVAITQLAATATNPRAFIIGNFFVVTFVATVAATPHLRYVAIPTSNPTNPNAAADISTQVASLTAGYDGAVYNSTLYLAWSGSDGGGAIRGTFFSSNFVIGSSIVLAAASSATLVSVAIDTTNPTPRIWVSFWTASTGAVLLVNQNYASILASTAFIAAGTLTHLTSYSTNSILTLLYEVSNTYSYSSVRSDYLESKTVTVAGVVSSATVIARSVGLASKMFSYNSTYYFLTAYAGALQPSYFLMDLGGNIVSKLAYSNGGGYNSSQVLAQASNNVAGEYCIAYLFKDLLVSTNTQTNVTGPTANLYTQTGVNLAKFDLSTAPQYNSNIASNLVLTGGTTWAYDGTQSAELGFNVFPEDLGLTTATTGGLMIPQTYFYVATYEWTDAAGSLHRSAPSVPQSIVVPGGTSTNTVTVKVPTLRLTYKTSVRIVIYRWSTAQQNYYQISSITSPTLNSKTTDSVTVVDTVADTAILGNTLLYTTGGVVENIGAPASSVSTLFKSRLFLVDSENRNLIWFSKQIIQGVPIEMSDLFTLFIAPTTGSQGSTGDITALSAMDDKLIIFKDNAIYYVTGIGPDNTGANNDFTDPVFITGTVGCANQDSLVFMPSGIMFQSDKGIWLLGRDLSTTYIGSAIQAYNDDTVNSALAIPTTNQVRFTLDSGAVLMYDYFEQQWGTFSNIPAISSTLYNGLQTYLNDDGQVLQETPDTYLDNTSPVLMSFTTAWLKTSEIVDNTSVSRLQGLQRVYRMFLLANYKTPHKLNVQVAYDYDPSIAQSSLITPLNYSAPFGGDTLFGSGSPYGGRSSVEQWRINFQRQKCQALQIKVTESFDPSYDTVAGAGLTFSGLKFIVGVKSQGPKLPAAQSVG